MIYEAETFGGTSGSAIPKQAESLADGNSSGNCVVLRIHEPLPPIKELTATIEEHWLELLHAAIVSASREKRLPLFEKAFVWIEIVTLKAK